MWIAPGRIAVEFIIKDISTVRYQPERLWDWSQIIMAEIRDHET